MTRVTISNDYVESFNPCQPNYLKLSSLLQDWLFENVGKRDEGWRYIQVGPEGPVLEFVEDAKAIMFKLTFGGQ